MKPDKGFGKGAQSDMVTIAAVVVTYNRLALLQQGIDCLLAQKLSSDAALDVLVIDNASTDGTGEALAGRVKAGEIRYFNTGANLGGAGGFNWGMRQAVQDGYDFVWIMDDDCQPHEDALQALLDDIQKGLFEQAKTYRDAHTTKVTNMDELGKAVETGFAKAMWCGERACEDEIKEKFNASSRNMPFDQEGETFGTTCVCCGKPAKKVMYFAKAY